MECPACGNRWIKVADTNNRERDYVARKRQCGVCDHVFFTVERVVPREEMTWRRGSRSGGKPTLRIATDPSLVPEIPGTIGNS